MKKLITLFSSLLIFSILSIAQQPVKLILDTDIALDVDDAGALAMLHRLQSLGECEILGIVVSSGSRSYDGYWGAACVDAIDSYYNRGDIPLGIYKGCHNIPDRVSNFSKQVADAFPHDLPNGAYAPEAWKLYRKILSEQADNSVVVVTVGFLNNLAALLKSGPDEYSAMTGIELVRKKVKFWSCMGGQFPQGNEEFNLNTYAHDAAYVMEQWPVKVIYGGFEVGWQVMTGGGFEKIYPPGTNPVAMAFKLYTGGADRYSWDEISAYVAVRGTANYFDVVRGTNRMEVYDPQVLGERVHSRNVWTDDPGGKDYYLVLKADPEDLAAELEKLMYAAPE
ncbi:MAG TPA: nucleoside hydrolase [Bacteroidales bacterium]|nr:nucleoside hydrolase [Bacteroidales bacterium]